MTTHKNFHFEPKKKIFLDVKFYIFYVLNKHAWLIFLNTLKTINLPRSLNVNFTLSFELWIKRTKLKYIYLIFHESCFSIFFIYIVLFCFFFLSCHLKIIKLTLQWNTSQYCIYIYWLMRDYDNAITDTLSQFRIDACQGCSNRIYEKRFYGIYIHNVHYTAQSNRMNQRYCQREIIRICRRIQAEWDMYYSCHVCILDEFVV